MKRSLGVYCGWILLALAGCGSSSSPDDGGPNPPEPGLLSLVTSAADLENSLKAGLTAMSSPQQLAAAPAAADAAAGNYTGTYTQEENVDEFDAVRYDGAHLFVAPRRYFFCCHILAPTAGGTSAPEPERSIRILATDPDNADASLAGTIPLEDEISVQGMYVADDRLVALTGRSIYGTYGELWADIAIWAPEEVGFRIYDVSDTSDPRLEVDVTLDGVFVESRRIGNTVYIVSRYTPYIDGLNYYVTNAAEQVQNQDLLASTTLDELLPDITINGTTRKLIAPDRCYVATDVASRGFPVLTSITAVPIDDPENFSTTCYNEETYGVYVSQDAMYFTEFRPDTTQLRDVTRIHKFALAGTDVRYRGSADIDGTVWRGGQADFRMSEHRGDLRVLASQFNWNNEDFVDHKLFVLREAAGKTALDIVSTLPNADRPEEIGKPNEALYGVRFLADRAYAVTFLQIDPLYAIDLSDPVDPRIAGELEVTGFSDFLHPVNDALLLGLGTGANGGVKLELFDVTDLSQPLLRGSMTLGGRGSFSEARYDRHAFAYQQGSDGIDRFTIPANIYAADGSFNYLGAELYLFEIRDKDMPALASLASAGSIDPPDINGAYWADRNRAFIHDDTVYYVRDEIVWSAFWNSPTVVNGPF